MTFWRLSLTHLLFNSNLVQPEPMSSGGCIRPESLHGGEGDQRYVLQVRANRTGPGCL